MVRVKIDFVTALSTCPICKKADEIIVKVLENYRGKIEVNHVDMVKGKQENIDKLKKKYGILMTPFIAINGEIFVNGKSPNEHALKEQIEKVLS